jgi:signal transduction histidine kinase
MNASCRADLVADIPPPPAYLVESYLIALQLMDADPVHAPLLQRLQAAQQTYQQRYQYWQRQGLSGEPGAALPDAIACAGAVVYQTAFGQLVPALRDGEELQARRALARLGTVYEQQRAVIERVVEPARQRNADDERSAREQVQRMAWSLVLVFALIVGVFILIFNTVRRSIAEPILDALKITQRVAGGDWSQQIRADARGEAGRLLQAIRDIVKNTQAEIVKAEKMAALGSLVAGVSHELNTPVGNGLMAVSTLNDDLRTFRGKMQEDQALGAGRVPALGGSGRRLAMRNLQRRRADEQLQAGGGRPRQFAAALARRCTVVHEPDDPAANAEAPIARCSTCRTGWSLDSFPGPLGQVITNLIENAFKHGLDGMLRRHHAARGRQRRHGDDFGGDGGKGIAPELQASRVRTVLRLGQGGSGLGLHIAHNIIYQILPGADQCGGRGRRGHHPAGSALISVKCSFNSETRPVNFMWFKNLQIYRLPAPCLHP